jgi:hypothetical protein
MTKTTRTEAGTTTGYPCAKCSGSGVIHEFGHVKNGVCFDCGGTGEVAVLVTGGSSTIKDARLAGEALLAGARVPTEAAAEALAVYDDLGPCRWIGNRDYDRRNALAVLVAEAAAAAREERRAARAAARAARTA